MRPTFKPSEGKDRMYLHKLKRHDLDRLHDKLPNEFKHCLEDYNYNNMDGIGYIDINDYMIE